MLIKTAKRSSQHADKRSAKKVFECIWPKNSNGKLNKKNLEKVGWSLKFAKQMDKGWVFILRNVLQ